MNAIPTKQLLRCTAAILWARDEHDKELEVRRLFKTVTKEDELEVAELMKIEDARMEVKRAVWRKKNQARALKCKQEEEE